MIALRTIDELPCNSDVSIEAIWLLCIKRKRPMFRLSKWLPTRTARTHAACVSLSFFNDVKQRGELLLLINATGQEAPPYPFWVVPAVRASCIMNAHRDVGATERCASLSDGGYMRDASGVSSISSQKIHRPESMLKSWGFQTRPGKEIDASRDRIAG